MVTSVTGNKSKRTTTLCKEELTIAVIAAILQGKHFFKTEVVIGSKLHVVVFTEQMIMFPCVCVVGVKFSKDVPLKFFKSVSILWEQEVVSKEF